MVRSTAGGTRRRHRQRTDDAGEDPAPAGDRAHGLQVEAEHDGVVAVGDQRRRHRQARAPALPVAAGRGGAVG
ncbi:hypothetical protein, partial [Rubrivivax gelatinosus]|uniref:hypothetical protein n=1 Tax=Rubrivivax gelatinosus TaxID=28068 RepID=UPI001ED938F1